jgi:diguanylate cyclase (GGDEF)-like protein
LKRLTNSQWLRALAQPVTYLGVAMLASIFVTAAYLINEDRKNAVKEAQRQGENLARLFEQSVLRSFKNADNTILALRRSFQNDPVNTDLVAWATDPQLKNDLTFQFSIVGPDGRIKASSLGAAPLKLNISTQEHFRTQVAATEDRLYIGAPVVMQTTGKRAMMLTRRLVAPDGSFNGVLSASFDVLQLERFYQAIDLGEDGVISLIGLDGVMRAAAINGQSNLELIGRRFPNAGVLKAVEKSSSGNYWNSPDSIGDVRRPDNIKRLISYRLIDGFPLIALVGISEAAVFKHAAENKRIYLSISSVLTVGILIAIGFGVVRERKLLAATSEITRQAYHDDLTGLANRALLRKHVDGALARFKQSGQCFNLISLDLDHFKIVNDSLGHAAGDELIRQVARRLTDCVGEMGIVARMGGDEFAILQLVNGDQRDAAIVLANRFLEAVGEPYDLDGHQAIVETSIGIALAPSSAEDADQLLKNADLALYKAKSDGRNVFCIFESQMSVEARHRYDLESDLRNSIMRDEFEVYYQPLVDAEAGNTCGFEALVRWLHPQRGVVMPNTFIPIAESTGLIVPLGEWILRRACADAINWPSHIKVAVNLSAIQFRKGDIVGVVSKALLDSGLAPERLELEITESVLLQKDASNISKLHELRNLGVSIALDDFGTGYSSLSYLQIFPFDKIKIDRSFIAGMATRSDCAAIVCAVTGLARSLDVTTTAEGVETLEQCELLRAAGCSQAQGFLFGRPSRLSDVRLDRLQEREDSEAAA